MPKPVHDHRSTIRTASCVLHIGAPKTGSTGLQCFLGDNRAHLAAAGLLYPGSIERGHAHHDLAFLTAGGYPEWASSQPASLGELLAAIQTEFQAQPALRKLLLSSENFYWLSDPEAVRRMLDTLGHRPEQIAVVVYIRRQEDAIESWYNQLVKALGYSADFSQSIADYDSLWDYHARLSGWAAVFGEDRIVPRIYPDDDDDFDIRRDFVALLELADPDLHYAPDRPNRRLVRDLLEFQRIINRLPLPTMAKRRHHKRLIHLSAHAEELGLEDAPLHTPATRQAIRSRYAEGNRIVARSHFDRDAMFPPATAARTAASAELPPLAAEKQTAILAWLQSNQPDNSEGRP